MYRPNGNTKTPVWLWNMETSASGEHGWGPHTRDIPYAVSLIVIIFKRPAGSHMSRRKIEHAMRFPDRIRSYTTTTHDKWFLSRQLTTNPKIQWDIYKVDMIGGHCRDTTLKRILVSGRDLDRYEAYYRDLLRYIQHTNYYALDKCPCES